jgi:hypothetical protein
VVGIPLLAAVVLVRVLVILVLVRDVASGVVRAVLRGASAPAVIVDLRVISLVRVDVLYSGDIQGLCVDVT